MSHLLKKKKNHLLATHKKQKASPLLRELLTRRHNKIFKASLTILSISNPLTLGLQLIYF